MIISLLQIEKFYLNANPLKVNMAERYLIEIIVLFLFFSSIDNNDNYDDLDEEGKDEEEKYFDDEEPEFIYDAHVT